MWYKKLFFLVVIVLKYEENKSIKFFFLQILNKWSSAPSCTVMTHDDKRASVTGYECSMFHIHVSDVDVTRCEIHTTRRVSCHSDSWMKYIHSCEQHGAYMSLHSCHHQCTVSSSVSNCVCVFVLQKGYNLTSTVFFHTQIDKKAILRSWKKCMRTKLQKNELWL